MSWSADTDNQDTYGTTNPHTLSYTCAATAKLLVVCLFVAGGTGRTGGNVTYNAKNMTDSGQGFVCYATSPEAGVEIWFMINPDTGAAHDISVPNTNGVNLQISASSWIPSLGGCAKDTSNKATGTTANPSLTLTVNQDGTLVISGLGSGYKDAPTAGSGYQIVNTYDAGAMVWGDERALAIAASSATVAFTQSADDWGQIAIGFKELTVYNLAVSDSACVSAAEVSGALTGVQNIKVNDSACVSALETFKISKNSNIIGIADAFCTSQTDSTILSFTTTLAITDAYVTTQADALVLSGSYTLSVADSTSETQADAVILEVPSGASLVVEDCSCESGLEEIGVFPQVVFPVGDVTDGTWTNQSGSSIDLYDSVNESNYSDSDYIQSAYDPSNDVCVLQLGALSDPGVHTGHVLYVRLGKEGSGTQQCTVELRQDYVSETEQGTLIDTATETLSGVETAAIPITHADLISDYSSLFIRLVAV